MSKETAFYGRLQAMTDRWMDLFGYHAPAVVTDTQLEYRAVREAAGLMDFSMLRKVDLDGAGALALVDSIVCRDVSTLGQPTIATTRSSRPPPKASASRCGNAPTSCPTCAYKARTAGPSSRT
jgi:hypothetical protein